MEKYVVIVLNPEICNKIKHAIIKAKQKKRVLKLLQQALLKRLCNYIESIYSSKRFGGFRILSG